jgi:hypothetical protein
MEVNPKGRTILKYESSAEKNGQPWPSQLKVEQELALMKELINLKHHPLKNTSKAF